MSWPWWVGGAVVIVAGLGLSIYFWGRKLMGSLLVLLIKTQATLLAQAIVAFLAAYITQLGLTPALLNKTISDLGLLLTGSTPDYATNATAVGMATQDYQDWVTAWQGLVGAVLTQYKITLDAASESTLLAAIAARLTTRFGA